MSTTTNSHPGEVFKTPLLISSNSWEDSPSYTDFVIGSYYYLTHNIIQTATNFTYKDLSFNIKTCLNNVHTEDLYVILALSVVWTVLRHVMTNWVFLPLADRCDIPPDEKDKLPESAWKFFFYFLSWLSTACVIFGEGGGKDFRHPSSIWEEYSVDSSVSSSYYAMFAIQTSFYVYSVYASVFLDAWRKDSIVLLIHHFITIILFTFSWSARYHRSAIITVLLHDVCDVILEGTKSLFYFKKQGNKNVKWIERIADIGFLAFTVVWAVNRLYFFPLRVMYYSAIVVDSKQIHVPFGFLLNSLMYLLLGMNIYWFTFILNVLRKVIMGERLEDIRDIKEEEGEKDDNVKEVDIKSKEHQPLVLTKNGRIKTRRCQVARLKIANGNGNHHHLDERIEDEITIATIANGATKTPNGTTIQQEDAENSHNSSEIDDQDGDNSELSQGAVLRRRQRRARVNSKRGSPNANLPSGRSE